MNEFITRTGQGENENEYHIIFKTDELENYIRVQEFLRQIIGNGKPGVDVALIVRCKDCNQWDEEGSYLGRGWCGYQMKSTGPRYFCADGEVEEGEEDDETGDH